MLRVTCEIQQLEAEPIQTRYDLSGFERIKETDSNMQTGTKKKRAFDFIFDRNALIKDDEAPISRNR